MRSKREATEVVELFLSMLFRGTTAASVASAAFIAVGAAWQLLTAERTLVDWTLLLCGSLGVVTSGWLAVTTWRTPLIRITAREIEIGHPGAGIRQRIPLDELVSWRWQDSFDLRVRSQSGTEYAVHLGQVALPDRQRIEAVLRERIGAVRVP